MKLAIFIGLLAVVGVVSARFLSYHWPYSYYNRGLSDRYYACTFFGYPSWYCRYYDCFGGKRFTRSKPTTTTTTTARPEVIHKQETARPSQQESYTTQKTTSITTEQSSEMGFTEEYKVTGDFDKFDSRPVTKESSKRTVETDTKSDKEFSMKRTKRDTKRPHFELQDEAMTRFSPTEKKEERFHYSFEDIEDVGPITQESLEKAALEARIFAESFPSQSVEQEVDIPDPVLDSRSIADYVRSLKIRYGIRGLPHMG